VSTADIVCKSTITDMATMQVFELTMSTDDIVCKSTITDMATMQAFELTTDQTHKSIICINRTRFQQNVTIMMMMMMMMINIQ
jgi:hypothetical protein